MSHSHSHSGELHSKKVARALVIGILLNILFVIVEAGVGFWQNSLALLSDAGHNLSDVASLALALLAIRLSRVKPNDKFTYGYRKTTILVALLNAVILLIAIGGIGYEAVQRIFNPQPVEGGTMAIVAGIGILINGFTAYLFIQSKDHDLNIKGAYLHMVADTLVSLGVVIAGLLIMQTGWYLLDPLISFAIMIVILVSTWDLLRDSIRLSLDGVPRAIDMEKVKEIGKDFSEIKDIHHIHVWAISTTQNALTAHLVVKENTSLEKIELLKHQLKEKLSHLNIHHSTFEIEIPSSDCVEADCEEQEPDLRLSHHHH